MDDHNYVFKFGGYRRCLTNHCLLGYGFILIVYFRQFRIFTSYYFIQKVLALEDDKKFKRKYLLQRLSLGWYPHVELIICFIFLSYFVILFGLFIKFVPCVLWDDEMLSNSVIHPSD